VGVAPGILIWKTSFLQKRDTFDVFSLRCVGISVRTWKTIDLGDFLRNAQFLRDVSVM